VDRVLIAWQRFETYGLSDLNTTRRGIDSTLMPCNIALTIVFSIMFMLVGCASDDTDEPSDVTVRGTIQGASGPVDVGLILIRSNNVTQVTNVTDTFASDGPFQLSTPLPDDTDHLVNWTLIICANPLGQDCDIRIDDHRAGPIGPGLLSENAMISCEAASPCEHAQFNCFLGDVLACPFPMFEPSDLSCNLDGTPSPAFTCCRDVLDRDFICQ
jgi:hypothetical protein